MTDQPRARPTGKHMTVVETGELPNFRDVPEPTESKEVPRSPALPLGHSETDQLGRRFDFFKSEVRSDLERVFLHLRSLPDIQHSFAELQRFSVASEKLMHERIDGVDTRLGGMDLKLASIERLLMQLVDVK